MGRDVPLGKWELTDTFTKFGPKIWPIHLPAAPILRHFYKIYVKVVQIWEIFSKKSRKELRPIFLPKFRFEKGSFIYQRSENGTLFRGTSQYLLSPEYPHPLLLLSNVFNPGGVLEKFKVVFVLSVIINLIIVFFCSVCRYNINWNSNCMQFKIK